MIAIIFIEPSQISEANKEFIHITTYAKILGTGKSDKILERGYIPYLTISI
jgi:hypothetical protein